MKKLAALALALTVPFVVNAAVYNIKDIDNFESALDKIPAKPKDSSLDSVPTEVQKYVETYVRHYVDSRLDLSKNLFMATDTGYSVLSNNHSTVSVAIHEIKPYASGTEVVLRVINWMGVPLTNLKFNVTFFDHQDNQFEKKDVSLSQADPAVEKRIQIRLSKKPEQLQAMYITYLGATGIKYDPVDEK